MSILILVGSVLLWGVVHSVLASLAAKGSFERWFGATFMRFYRLGYNVFAAVTFLPILVLMAYLPDQSVYAIPSPFSYVFLLGQVTAAVLLLIGVLQTDTWSFVGLRQLVEKDDQPGQLVTSGLYRWVRHPLYFSGLLFIWLTPSVSLNMLIVYIALTVYILIGAHFEERKLLREFGQEYARYQAETAMIIPGVKLPFMRGWQNHPSAGGTNQGG